MRYKNKKKPGLLRLKPGKTWKRPGEITGSRRIQNAYKGSLLRKVGSGKKFDTWDEKLRSGKVKRFRINKQKKR